VGDRFQSRQSGRSHLGSEKEVDALGIASDPLANVTGRDTPQRRSQAGQGRVILRGVVPVFDERERAARAGSRPCLVAQSVKSPATSSTSVITLLLCCCAFGRQTGTVFDSRLRVEE
jgi:hypothetical protein